MHEVSELLVALLVEVDVAGHVEDSLAGKRLAVGRHVAEVVPHHEHLHHRLVGVEECLGKMKKRRNDIIQADK